MWKNMSACAHHYFCLFSFRIGVSLCRFFFRCFKWIISVCCISIKWYKIHIKNCILKQNGKTWIGFFDTRSLFHFVFIFHYLQFIHCWGKQSECKQYCNILESGTINIILLQYWTRLLYADRLIDNKCR